MSRVEKARTEFAENVARSLKDGIVPWQRKDLPAAPVQSATSGNSYRGLNAMYLMGKCAEAGYADPRFITAAEANKRDLWVRKGEHGVPLEHWSVKEGKPEVRMYVVFNAAQLSGDLSKLPAPNAPADLATARERLKEAGVNLSADSDVEAYRSAVKNLVSKFAEDAGYKQEVHTPELMALRANIATTFVMREIGIPVEQPEGLPTKSWASSIQHDPTQLYKATRDGSHIAKGVLAMTQEREAHLFRAAEERGEAQKAQEFVAEAVSIPRGADFNLSTGPDADLSATQETVVAAAEKASLQVNDLRASASRHEANAPPNALAQAHETAKKGLGSGAVVTSAQAGRSYDGKIAAVLGSCTDKVAIQMISDNHAILHTIRDAATRSALKVGQEMTLTVDAEWNSVVQDRQNKQAQRTELTREGMKR